jgi:hypothetical protein
MGKKNKENHETQFLKRSMLNYEMEKISKKKLMFVTPGHRGDCSKIISRYGKRNRYLTSCSFRGKCLVQGVAT